MDENVNGKANPTLFTTIPVQQGASKPGQMTKEQLQQYFSEGYVILKRFLKPEELDPVQKAIEDLVDQLAKKLFNAGKITCLHAEKGLFERLTALEKDFPGANVILHKHGALPQAFRDLWSNERLLNVVEQVIGPDIAGHPVWNIRTKTPHSPAMTSPWHQDNAYFDVEAMRTLIVTAWIPLLDVTVQHGCLEIMKNAHRSGRLATHTCCSGQTWYVEVEPEELEKSLGVEMKPNLIQCPINYGDVIFFTNLTPHRSLENYSDVVRWSLDLRWSDPNKPWGFYGMKEGVIMRTKDDPKPHLNWDAFDKVDRHKVAEKELAEDLKKHGVDETELQTILTGPWMRRGWKITNQNKHTEALREEIKHDEEQKAAPVTA